MHVLFSPDGLGTMLHMVIRALAMAANEEYHNSQYRSLFRLEPPFLPFETTSACAGGGYRGSQLSWL